MSATAFAMFLGSEDMVGGSGALNAVFFTMMDVSRRFTASVGFSSRIFPGGDARGAG